MSKKAEADVPTMYPLKGEHRKPEKAKQGIIDLTKKVSNKQEKEKEKSKEKGKIEIKDKIEIKEKEEEDETIEENLIPLPVIRQNKIQTDFLPNKIINKILKPTVSKERLEDYEGLLKPTPIEIELRGQLPPFDADRELNFDFPKMIPTKEELEKENFKLMNHISDRDIFRKHIPKQVELEKFIKALKEKVIHDYNIPITVKELRAEYNNSPYFKDIVTYITRGYCRYVGKAQRLFKMSCEDYIVMNGILFRIRYERHRLLEENLH